MKETQLAIEAQTIRTEDEQWLLQLNTKKVSLGWYNLKSLDMVYG